MHFHTSQNHTEVAHRSQQRNNIVSNWMEKPARMSFDGIGTTVRKFQPPWMRLEFGFVYELATPYLTSTHVVGLIRNVDDEKRTHVCIASPRLFGKHCMSHSHHEQTSTCLRAMWQDMVTEVIEGIICTWSFTTE
jgi:hypothetical protein